MKKNLFFIIFLLSSYANACDICGCGASSYYLGIMPQYHQNFLGIRYRYQSYDSHINSTFFRSQEVFQSSELWGRFYLSHRWQVVGILPYQFNRQKTQTGVKNLSGIGDAVILTNYQVFSYADSVWKHQIWVGTGVKAATGKHSYSQTDANTVANPNFQLGTGSWDWLNQFNYTLRYKNWGWSNDISYKINTKNSEGYQFGNRLTIQTSIFVVQQLKAAAIMPYGGFFGDFSEIDQKNGVNVANTGGQAFFGQIGFDFFYKKITFGSSLQSPIIQNLGQGEILANPRFTFNLAYLF